MRGHRRIGGVEGHLDGEGGIAKQNVAAILETDAERLPDQQRRETSAIHEQIARDLSGLSGDNAFDVAAFVLDYVRHIGQHVSHAQLLGAVLLQEGGELAGIQVVGVVRHGLVLGSRNQLGRQSLVAQLALGTDVIREALVPTVPQPVRREIELRERLRKHQRVVVPIVLGAGGPARELRSLLECSIAVTEEISLGHSHFLESGSQRRPGAFADTNDLDRRRFDQRHREAARHAASVARGDDARGQPSRGPTSDNDD